MPPQGRGDAVRIALAAHLAVGDDVDARALHVADGEEGGVVLRGFQILGRDAPYLLHAHARREPRGEILAVDEPFRLGVAAYDGGGQEFSGAWNILLISLKSGPADRSFVLNAPRCDATLGRQHHAHHAVFSRLEHAHRLVELIERKRSA